MLDREGSYDLRGGVGVLDGRSSGARVEGVSSAARDRILGPERSALSCSNAYKVAHELYRESKAHFTL